MFSPIPRRTANFGILEEMLFLVCLFDLFGKKFRKQITTGKTSSSTHLSVSHGGVLRGGGGGVFGLGIC